MSGSDPDVKPPDKFTFDLVEASEASKNGHSTNIKSSYLSPQKELGMLGAGTFRRESQVNRGELAAIKEEKNISSRSGSSSSRTPSRNQSRSPHPLVLGYEHDGFGSSSKHIEQQIQSKSQRSSFKRKSLLQYK